MKERQVVSSYPEEKAQRRQDRIRQRHPVNDMQQGTVLMRNKIYVGNLSPDITEEDLKYNFGELGTCVSVKIIRDKHSGFSRGFAFVEMATEKEAREAVQKCKGVELDGKKLIVREARPKKGNRLGRAGPG